MRIKWLAHAAFLIEGDGLRIITDPYTPEVLGFAPINEAADVVIRSSSDDAGHCNAAMIPGKPVVVTATEIGTEGTEVMGVRIRAIPAQESLIHKDEPADNAMYRFKMEGIEIAHLGDVGNRLNNEQLQALGTPDVVIAPTGGPPTIDLQDLFDALRIIQPRVIIPMHFGIPGSKVAMLPVTEFTRLFPLQDVTWSEDSAIELTYSTLSHKTPIIVLKPSTI